ncbi:hypothetical protein QQX98_007120 [Neonectria punicea]|uniref:Transcription factor domain-containing protein n=1 Tax=Neonectria punicea TaxID=979145 RepID=A0ABR1GYV0_9HYPO
MAGWSPDSPDLFTLEEASSFFLIDDVDLVPSPEPQFHAYPGLPDNISPVEEPPTKRSRVGHDTLISWCDDACRYLLDTELDTELDTDLDTELDTELDTKFDADFDTELDTELDTPSRVYPDATDQTETINFDNFCKSRSIGPTDNVWKQLSHFLNHPEICYPILSLVGVFIGDRLSVNHLEDRLDEYYRRACASLRGLQRKNDKKAEEENLLICVAIILATRDIAVTDRPIRWLELLKVAEDVITSTDNGQRYWDRCTAMPRGIDISQRVLVGKGIILAQVMAKLPSEREFSAHQSSARFGWLLAGTEVDVKAINSDCGMSRRLLHNWSEITRFAAMIQHYPVDNSRVPFESSTLAASAASLCKELDGQRPCIKEERFWAPCQRARVAIDPNTWRLRLDVVQTVEDMTQVTADAWMFAAILYFYCRVYRLPRNHPHILMTLEELSRCIQTTPTSGPLFTAQAPILPVFLLGMLAFSADHRRVAREWFEKAVAEPLRRSILPVYETLKLIRTWLDEEVFVPMWQIGLPTQIDKRHPWWEELVSRLRETEDSEICFL